MESRFAATNERWPPASQKRRVLAWYLDFLLFGSPWAILVWGFSQVFPFLAKLSLPISLLLFLPLESLLLRLISWSPGHWLLAIRRLPADPFAPPEASERRRARYVVEPWLKSNERWWTILFGVLLILDGAKSLVRWTMWTPPIPFMGVQLDEAASIVAMLAFGALKCALGYAALRLRPWMLLLGAAYYVLDLSSTLLSWRLLPGWVERYQIARRAYQGVPVREGEGEMMQRMLPGGIIVLAFLMIIWMLFAASRIRRARKT